MTSSENGGEFFSGVKSTQVETACCDFFFCQPSQQVLLVSYKLENLCTKYLFSIFFSLVLSSSFLHPDLEEAGITVKLQTQKEQSINVDILKDAIVLLFKRSKDNSSEFLLYLLMHRRTWGPVMIFLKITVLWLIQKSEICIFSGNILVHHLLSASVFLHFTGETDLDAVSEACLPYLSCRQPIRLQEACLR